MSICSQDHEVWEDFEYDMLQYFFEESRDEFNGNIKDNSYLFDGFNIMKVGKITRHI
jgi:hypothetical protein